MTINEFYEKHKATTNLKIAQMNAIEDCKKKYTREIYINMLDTLKGCLIITKSEYLDLFNLEV